MLEIKDLAKSYGRKIALEIPELNIESNEIVGLVGNNGAGKTTLMSLILDLIEAKRGAVYSKGEAVAKSEHWKSYTSSFMGDSFLIPFLRVEEYLQFIQGLHGISNQDYEAFKTRMTSFFSEGFNSNTLIRDLSLGNKNKVGIMGALLPKSELILLDEPFANLDPSSQFQLKKLIQEQKSMYNCTIIVSSHDLGHVIELSDRILLIESGKIIKDSREKSRFKAELDAYFVG